MLVDVVVPNEKLQDIIASLDQMGEKYTVELFNDNFSVVQLDIDEESAVVARLRHGDNAVIYKIPEDLKNKYRS
jgi:hypothetical protein